MQMPIALVNSELKDAFYLLELTCQDLLVLMRILLLIQTIQSDQSILYSMHENDRSGYGLADQFRRMESALRNTCSEKVKAGYRLTNSQIRDWTDKYFAKLFLRMNRAW